MARKLDETLQSDEIGILFMRENHQVQFPSDIQVFYVAPPALDEIKRWLREREQQPTKPTEKESEEKGPEEKKRAEKKSRGKKPKEKESGGK